MTQPVAWSAADALREAKKLVDAFGWPTYSPWKALHAIEKKMKPGDPQISLMLDIAIKEAVRQRREYSGLHPIHEIHARDGQTKEGIAEWFNDCIDRAEHHPLNGATKEEGT
jgi:hypothetical protein